MKKLVALILLLCLFTGCEQTEKQDDRITVCATLFPQYDFCRQIAGDKAEITLLLPPGMESHNYEPGVNDIKMISQSDIFIYTGASMEPWAERILDGTETVRILDVSENIDICSHVHTEEEQHREHEEGDPHIWTSPKNALIMAEDILEALCEADPENEGYYRKNAEEYFEKLNTLDKEFTQLSKECEGITLCHGGKLAMSYLQRDYGFEFLVAYDSCSSSAEPSVKRVKEIIDTINEEKLNGVFYEELSSGRVAETISQETGVPVLLLHTCHNLTKSELENGETYVSLMEKNIENIKKVIENVKG